MYGAGGEPRKRRSVALDDRNTCGAARRSAHHHWRHGALWAGPLLLWVGCTENEKAAGVGDSTTTGADGPGGADGAGAGADGAAPDDSGGALDTGPAGDALTGTENAGAVVLDDEREVGGGDDGWRPTAAVRLECPWLPQVPPGDWTTTMNCGPASLLMAEACMRGGAPGGGDIIDLIDWMDANISTYAGVGAGHSGSATSTTQLVATADGYFGLAAERKTGLRLQDAYAELAAGRPVIVTTLTQSGNDHPSTTMSSRGAPHFMMLVGMTPTTVILHDPGRSASLNAEDREFSITSFHATWSLQGNAAVTFPADTRAEGGVDRCVADGDALQVEGWLRAEPPLERWSLTLDGLGTAHSAAATAASFSFDESISIAHLRDGGAHQVGLWGLPAGATEGVLLDVCDFSTTTTSTPAADLVVGAVSVSDTTPNVGDSVTVSGAISNAGAVASGAYTVGVYLSTDGAVSSGDTLLGSWSEGSIAAGGSDSYSRAVSIPSGAAGALQIIVAADTGGVVTELSEANNSAARAITVSAPNAVDLTDAGGWCSGAERDILRASSVTLIDATSNPSVEATFRKCDGTPFSTSKDCIVRVGSYLGIEDPSLVRASFTWSAGRSSTTVRWPVWLSAGDFLAAYVGDTKDFYIVCEEPAGDWNHWRAENPIVIERR
jgi:hypothetical protein